MLSAKEYNTVSVSVVIPAYNAEKTILKCIDSVEAQKINNLEIVVVDDGSTDLTASIVKSIEKDNVKLISQKNSGVSCARNAGIENACGKFIYFIDSDDYLDENALGQLLKIQNEYELDIVASEINDVDGTSKTKYIFSEVDSFVATTRKDIGRNMYYVRLGSAVGKLIKKSIIDEYQIRFKQNIGLAEDFIFVHECMLRCKSLGKVGSSKYLVKNRPISLSKMFVPNIDMVIQFQNDILVQTFNEYKEYKNTYYRYEMNYFANGLVMFIKNMYLIGSTYNYKDRRMKIKSLYNSGKMKVFNDLTEMDAPKFKIDKIYCAVIKTKSLFIVETFFSLREIIRKAKTKKKYRKDDNE